MYDPVDVKYDSNGRQPLVKVWLTLTPGKGYAAESLHSFCLGDPKMSISDQDSGAKKEGR
jgi:hypothetical protein